jgi:hypothetical protein
VSPLEVLLYCAICVVGAVAAGQTSWHAMDRLVAQLGVEPLEWLQRRLGRDS